MTSFGNAFRITGPLWVESTGHILHVEPVIWNFDLFFIVSLNAPQKHMSVHNANHVLYIHAVAKKRSCAYSGNISSKSDLFEIILNVPQFLLFRNYTIGF